MFRPIFIVALFLLHPSIHYVDGDHDDDGDDDDDVTPCSVPLGACDQKTWPFSTSESDRFMRIC